MATRPWGAPLSKPSKQLAVYIPTELSDRFIRCTRNEKLSPSSIVETALDEWLTKNGYAPLPKKDDN